MANGKNNNSTYKVYGTNQSYSGMTVEVGGYMYTTVGGALEGNSLQLVANGSNGNTRTQTTRTQTNNRTTGGQYAVGRGTTPVTPGNGNGITPGTGMGVPSYAVNRANRSQYENNAPMSDWTIECCGNDPVSGTGDGAGSQYHMTMVGCMDQCGSATIY